MSPMAGTAYLLRKGDWIVSSDDQIVLELYLKPVAAMKPIADSVRMIAAAIS